MHNIYELFMESKYDKTNNDFYRLGRTELKPWIGNLLNNLFALIKDDSSNAEKTTENEYIMKGNHAN
jgi:hypothetical protein